MKSSTFKICTSLFAFALTIYSPFGLRSAIAADNEKIIGLTLPLSGHFQKLGEQLGVGAKLAFEDYKASTNTEAIAPIRLVIKDDECTADGGKSVAKDFVKMQAAIVTGFLCYKSFGAAQDILSPANIPSLSGTIRHPHHAQTRENKGWESFTFGGKRRLETAATAGIILQRFYDKPYALIDDGSIESRNFIDAIRSVADARGITPVHVDNFRPLQPAQSALVRRLKKTGAKAAFVAGDANDIAIIARDIKSQGLDIELIGGEELAVLPYIQERFELPKNIKNLFAIMQPDLLKLDGAQPIIKALEAKSINAEDYAIIGYALMQVALDAINNDASVVETLKNDTFITVLGEIKFDKNGEATPFSYKLQQWQADHFSSTFND